MANIISRESLGEQHPSEIVQYTFDLTENDAFVGSSAETLDESATWRIIKSTALTSDLSSTMVHSTAYSNTNKTISVKIKLGTTGSVYYLACLLEVASGSKYVVIGKLKFTDKSVASSLWT